MNAKVGDKIRIGNNMISIIEVAGRVRIRIEAEKKLLVEYVPAKQTTNV